MAMHPQAIRRALISVEPSEKSWLVKLDGAQVDLCGNRQDAVAAATRAANFSQNAGRPAQIVYADEPSFRR
jgi:hypothetical protein